MRCTMGGAMGADAKERGPLGRRIDALRQRTAVVERAITLGLITLIAASFVHWMVTLRIAGPLLQSKGLGPGVLTDLIAALLGQVGFLIVLPVFSWMVGWVFEGSPLKLCLGAAAFVEAWFLFIVYLADGSQVLLARPIYLSAHLLLALAAGLLGAKAFSHARGLAEARERRGRRIAPEAPVAEAAKAAGPVADSPADADAADPVSEAAPADDASGSATS